MYDKLHSFCPSIIKGYYQRNTHIHQLVLELDWLDCNHSVLVSLRFSHQIMATPPTCDNSSLSTIASIVGILTFASALILSTYVFVRRAKGKASSGCGVLCSLRSLEAESKEVLGLAGLTDSLPQHMQPIQTASRHARHIQEILATITGPKSLDKVGRRGRSRFLLHEPFLRDTQGKLESALQKIRLPSDEVLKLLQN